MDFLAIGIVTYVYKKRIYNIHHPLVIIMGIYLLASHENSGEVEIKKRRRKSYCSETVKYGAILPTSPIDSQA